MLTANREWFFIEPALFKNNMRKKSIAAYGTWLVVFLILVNSATGFAESVITENTSGTFVTSGSNFYLGQSVTTPNGNAWDNISFNLVNSSTRLPFAQGELFLLAASYAGTPANLNSFTSGFLASTTDIINGEWVFAPDVTLDPNTQYFLYTSTPFIGSQEEVLYGANPYSGGVASTAVGSGSYSSVSAADLVFTLSGTVVPVPEPSTLALTGLAGLSLPLFRRRK